MKITEVITDAIFIANVKKEVNDLIAKRVNRPRSKTGYRYKRDWYDRMRSENLFTSNFILNNAENVWLKKSNLSSEFRSVVLYIINKAYIDIISKES